MSIKCLLCAAIMEKNSWHTWYTVICPGYKIPGYFFGVIIRKIHRAVQEFNDSLYALTHVWVSMVFRIHFSISGHHMKHYFVHNVLLYCNKYLFIPTLYGNLKFHNYSIHPYHTEHGRLGVFHGEPPNSEKTNSQQTLTL